MQSTTMTAPSTVSWVVSSTSVSPRYRRVDRWTSPSGRKLRFEIVPGRKEMLLKGLDAIGETLEHAGDDIARFERRRSLTAPWLEARA